MELISPAYDARFIAITDGVDSANGFNEMSGIRNLFNDMYVSGIGFVKICDELSKEKVLSPSMYEFRKTGSRSGNPNPDRPYNWAQATVRKMLLNEVYCGDTVNFKTYTKSNKLRKRLKNSPDKILTFRDTHEAIVDRPTFDLVQKHFEGRKRPDKQGEFDMFAGYLYCADCGARMYLRRGNAASCRLKNKPRKAQNLSGTYISKSYSKDSLNPLQKPFIAFSAQGVCDTLSRKSSRVQKKSLRKNTPKRIPTVA